MLEDRLIYRREIKRGEISSLDFNFNDATYKAEINETNILLKRSGEKIAEYDSIKDLSYWYITSNEKLPATSENMQAIITAGNYSLGLSILLCKDIPKYCNEI